jgi:ankyrin repeat protein
MQRQKFIRSIAAIVPALTLFPAILKSQQTVAPKPASLDANLVRDFVGAGHNKFDVVRQMLADSPNLLYANWDWGGGDFENALEAAGHVGNKEIANFLIEKGARANLFVMTMLGKTEVVKTFIEANPAYLTARGPHGYTFLHHAQRGEEDAKELLDYFQSKGLTEPRFKLY